MKRKGSTIIDIAKALNKTASTVSRALNDHPSISPETKRQVLQMAKKLNYHPNTFAANLRKGRGNTIGLVVPRINRHFFSNVIHGVEGLANQHGFNVLICQSQESYSKEKEVINTLINNQVDGIIISISKETTEGPHIQAALDRGIPVVQFDRTLRDLATHQALNDNFTAAYEAVRHFKEQGYLKIAHLGGPQSINIYFDRYQGFLKGLKDHDLPLVMEWVFFDALSQQAAYEAARKIFSENGRPDAVFAVSDYAALGTLFALQDLNIPVPDEVGIIGFANEPFTGLTTPGLTAFDQHSEEMGRTAARLLFEQINADDQNRFIPKSISIKPELIVRKSSNRIFKLKQ